MKEVTKDALKNLLGNLGTKSFVKASVHMAEELVL